MIIHADAVTRQTVRDHLRHELVSDDRSLVDTRNSWARLAARAAVREDQWNTVYWLRGFAILERLINLQSLAQIARLAEVAPR